MNSQSAILFHNKGEFIITKEKLEIIKEALQEYKELSTKELKSYGLKNNDLAYLQHNKIIKKVRNHYYSLYEKPKVDLATIYSYLLNDDKESALKFLPLYLEYLGKPEIEPLITALIEQDIQNNDPAFMQTMVTLSKIYYGHLTDRDLDALSQKLALEKNNH